MKSRTFGIGNTKTQALVAGIYAAQFWSLGLFVPFFPIFLAERGMSVYQIGVLLAVPMAVRIICVPLISALADRMDERRKFLLLSSALAALSFTALYFASSFWLMFLSIFVASSFWMTVISLSDAYAGDVVRLEDADYGKMRLWGSLAFIVATLVGGYALQNVDDSFVVNGIVISLALMAILCLFLPDIKTAGGQVEQTTSQDHGIADQDWKTILISWRFLLPLAVTGAIQASHGVYYSFGSIYWQGLGVPSTSIGLLWAVGVAVEVGLFLIAGRLSMRLNSTGFIIIGGMAALVRWILFTHIDWYPGILILQCLHGLSFGATHMGMISLIRELIPAKFTGSAQGVNSTVNGIMISITTVFSGVLFELGPHIAFLSMAAIVAAGLVLLGLHFLQRKSID